MVSASTSLAESGHRPDCDAQEPLKDQSFVHAQADRAATNNFSSVRTRKPTAHMPFARTRESPVMLLHGWSGGVGGDDDKPEAAEGHANDVSRTAGAKQGCHCSLGKSVLLQHLL
mmetsp:Transcript_71964/g.166602  ORF Transcript_71964/g.166602 Transcript_71964/m.166602 type:complete len:115 (-) Transcript_71964:3288-3632(-)